MSGKRSFPADSSSLRMEICYSPEGTLVKHEIIKKAHDLDYLCDLSRRLSKLEKVSTMAGRSKFHANTGRLRLHPATDFADDYHIVIFMITDCTCFVGNCHRFNHRQLNLRESLVRDVPHEVSIFTYALESFSPWRGMAFR